MKSLFLASLLLLTPHIGNGQESTPPPRPDPPYLNRAPANSSWVMKCKPIPTPTPARGPSPAQGGPGSPPPPIQQLTVVKANGIIFEQRLDAAGRKTDRWIVGGVQAVRTAGSSEIQVSNGSGEDDLFDTSYTRTDFSGFDWLTDNTYTETKPVGGSNCFIFRGTVSNLTSGEATAMEAYYEMVKFAWEHDHGVAVDAAATGHKMQDPSSPELRAANHRVPAIACIDSESRLPVLLQTGREIRTYQFNPTPPGPLTLPPEVQQAIDLRQQRMKAAAALPAPP